MNEEGLKIVLGLKFMLQVMMRFKFMLQVMMRFKFMLQVMKRFINFPNMLKFLFSNFSSRAVEDIAPDPVIEVPEEIQEPEELDLSDEPKQVTTDNVTEVRFISGIIIGSK